MRVTASVWVGLWLFGDWLLPTEQVCSWKSEGWVKLRVCMLSFWTVCLLQLFTILSLKEFSAVTCLYSTVTEQDDWKTGKLLSLMALITNSACIEPWSDCCYDVVLYKYNGIELYHVLVVYWFEVCVQQRWLFMLSFQAARCWFILLLIILNPTK